MRIAHSYYVRDLAQAGLLVTGHVLSDYFIYYYVVSYLKLYEACDIDINYYPVFVFTHICTVVLMLQK